MTEAYICDAVRTPIGRYGGWLAHVRADDLAAIPIRALIERNPGVDWAELDDVIMGCANQAGEDNRNLARMAGLLAGLPDTSGGVTLNRLCGSGMDSVAMAARVIRGSEADMLIAGGSESMSRAPFVMAKAISAFDRNAEMYDTTIGWRFVNPKMRDSYGDDTMPSTAENVAQEFQVSRADQDLFAVRSQEKASRAQANGRLAAEIVPVSIPQRKGEALVVDKDEHPRETCVEALAKLRPIVRPDGTVTAGNASGVNDGAAALIVATEDAAGRNGLTPRARFLGAAVAGVPPRIMGIGPAPGLRETAQAARPQHRRHGRDRTQRSLRRPGPRGDAPARPPGRRSPREPERRRDRARPPARHVRRKADPDRNRGAPPDRRPLRALHDVHRRRPRHRDGDRAGLKMGRLRALAAGAWLLAAAPATAQTALPMPPAPPASFQGYRPAPLQLQLLFDTDSSIPISAHRELIPDRLAAYLVSAEDVGIQLAGHADRAGTREHNRALSCRRARWVRDALIARGVRRDRILLSAYGEDRPLRDIADGMPEMANRRVETIVTEGWREISVQLRQWQEGC